MLKVVGVDSPAVVLEQGNGFLSAKRLGILRAMRLAVGSSRPGDIILQDDWQHVSTGHTEAPDGSIVSFVDWYEEGHMCPMAFQVPDEDTRLHLIDVWANESKQACLGWKRIPKVVSLAVGS